MLGNDEIIIICKKAIDTWGPAMQQVVAMEECSELIEAIINSTIREPHNVEEEVADIEIMCIQLRIIFGSQEVDETDANMKSLSINKIIQTEAVKACADLIKSISKSIRDKESKIYQQIVWMEAICEQLRYTYNNEKVEEFKQAKLKRLRELVW